MFIDFIFPGQVPLEISFIVRLLAAGICGAIIGIERKNRFKEAGIKTHSVVAIASALFMLISKYGFTDIYIQYGVIPDAARIAAQIIPGISFLGAGMIMTKGYSVSGLTTAAGIWATAGIGMAIGGGMYFLGLTATIVLVLFQLLFHSRIVRKSMRSFEFVTVEMDDVPIEPLFAKLEADKCEVVASKVTKQDGGIHIELTINRTVVSRQTSIHSTLQHIDGIRSIEI